MNRKSAADITQIINTNIVKLQKNLEKIDAVKRLYPDVMVSFEKEKISFFF